MKPTSGTAYYTIEHNWNDLNNLDNMGYDTTDTPKFNTVATDWRYTINLDQTLIGFRQRFAANDLFPVRLGNPPDSLGTYT